MYYQNQQDRTTKTRFDLKAGRFSLRYRKEQVMRSTAVLALRLAALVWLIERLYN